MANSNLIRLQKFMADCGVASRRKCEELIENKKVKVNGHTAKLGDKINPKKDIISVFGKRISASEAQPVYIMLNKPRGYVTTVSDEFGRKTVMELVKNVDSRIYPVGRLDKDSEGLLLLTNDGNLANALTHPSHSISKIYRVTVRQRVDSATLDTLQNGIEIDGRKTKPCEITILIQEERRTVLEFVISEGRNRQIRRMCEAVGLEVIRLKRTAVGPVRLGMLGVGKSRSLTRQETDKLYKAAGLNDSDGKQRRAKQNKV